jgi:hypothetical protein
MQSKFDMLCTSNVKTFLETIDEDDEEMKTKLQNFSEMLFSGK